MAGLQQTTERKLDTALDDLISDDRGRDREGRRERRGSYGPASGHSDDRRGPYGSQDGRRGQGKSRGRGRLPAEDKALLNTSLFEDESGRFVVKLHDTQVAVMEISKAKQVATEAPSKVDEKVDEPKVADENHKEAALPVVEEVVDCEATDPGKEAEEGAAEEKTAEAEGEPVAPCEDGAVEAAVEAVAKDAEPARSESPVTKEKASDVAAAGTLVLKLTSGNYRTFETRYILNEVLRSLDLRLVELPESDRSWMVEGRDVSRRFEDGMELILTRNPSVVESIRRHLESHVEEAKRRDDGRGEEAHRGSSGGFSRPDSGPFGWCPPAQPPGYGWRPPHAYGHWPLPPGHGPPGNRDFRPYGGPGGHGSGAPKQPLPDYYFQ